MAIDPAGIDWFRDPRLVDDPYPYFNALRDKCPVEPEDHYGVTMVTGWEEAVAVYNDEKTFSSCLSVTGPFPGFPVPLEGDDVTDLIEKHRDELPFSDQLPTLGPTRPHQPSFADDAAHHAEAPQGERGRHVAARRRGARHLSRAGQG